jgi:hypothetical protein
MTDAQITLWDVLSGRRSKKTAITAKELACLMPAGSRNERSVREEIQGMIVGMKTPLPILSNTVRRNGDRMGFWVSADPEEIKAYMASLHHRCIEIFMRRKGVGEIASRSGLIEHEPGQMEMML